MIESVDGIYSGQLSGTHGFGLAMFVFTDGRITGADATGVVFKGVYSIDESGTAYKGIVTATVPPNVDLIQGVNSGREGMSYQVPVVFKPHGKGQQFLQITTPLGPVNVILTWLSEV